MLTAVSSLFWIPVACRIVTILILCWLPFSPTACGQQRSKPIGSHILMCGLNMLNTHQALRGADGVDAMA
jgi:hypothetical protein